MDFTAPSPLHSARWWAEQQLAHPLFNEVLHASEGIMWGLGASDIGIMYPAGWDCMGFDWFSFWVGMLEVVMHRWDVFNGYGRV